MAVEWVLGRCDPALLDLYEDPELTDDYVADTDCSRMIDQRRMQKVLICQMSVLDSLISVLEGLECPRKLLTEPRPSNPDNKARARWKAVKAEVKAQVEEMESTISTLQAKVEQIYTKRQTLKQLVQEIEKKKEMSEQLEQRLQQAQRLLHVCEGQLSELRVESETLHGYIDNWQVLKDELQGYVTATQEMLLYKIVSVSQSELCLELGPCKSDSNSHSPKLEPLNLSVTWSRDDRFRLQMRGGRAGMMEECFEGRISQLRATLVEVTERYTSQKDMLAEIQALHDSFAIDWRPAERQLMYLKSASVICILDVEMGYPTAGQATLVSVRKDTQLIDTALLQPPKDNLSLTQWLVFLSSCSLI